MLEFCRPLAEATNNVQVTPLHLACSNGHHAVVVFLVEECGVSLWPRTKDGKTPLECAAGWGHVKIAHYLSSRAEGKNVSQANGNGNETPELTRPKSHVDVVRSLNGTLNYARSVADTAITGPGTSDGDERSALSVSRASSKNQMQNQGLGTR